MNLITVENLTFAYEGKPVLEELNFNIEEGDYLCIVGENGAGKSTLIKGLLNLKQATKGKITMDNGLRPFEIGYLPQQTQVQNDFPATVYEIVLSGCLNKLKWKPFYTKTEKNLANQKIDELGITDLRKCCFSELSGGQKQRVLLARALCSTSKILLLDEPSAGLDPVVTENLYNLINEINKDKNLTIVMVSHDIESVIKYSNKVLHLQNRQLFFGSTKEYLQSEIGKKYSIGGKEND